MATSLQFEVLDDRDAGARAVQASSFFLVSGSIRGWVQFIPMVGTNQHFRGQNSIHLSRAKFSATLRKQGLPGTKLSFVAIISCDLRCSVATIQRKQVHIVVDKRQTTKAERSRPMAD